MSMKYLPRSLVSNGMISEQVYSADTVICEHQSWRWSEDETHPPRIDLLTHLQRSLLSFPFALSSCLCVHILNPFTDRLWRRTKVAPRLGSVWCTNDSGHWMRLQLGKSPPDILAQPHWSNTWRFLICFTFLWELLQIWKSESFVMLLGKFSML